jgi:hypothetical protein
MLFSLLVAAAPNEAPSLYAMPPAPHAALLRSHADDFIAMPISFAISADAIFSPFAIEPSQSYDAFTFLAAITPFIISLSFFD